MGNNAQVPDPYLSTEKQVSAIIALATALKKEKDRHEEKFNYSSKEAIDSLRNTASSIHIHPIPKTIKKGKDRTSNFTFFGNS
jgi:hypothetical protein